MDLITQITDNLPGWLQLLTAVVAAMAALDTVLPNSKASGFIGMVLKVVSMLGLNVGKAKNQEDAE